MAHWSNFADMPHLSGHTALVTGANSGLGYETALALAISGAHVVLACRDEKRGSEAVDRIRRTAPAADVELTTLDLADQSSIREFASRFNASRGRLDILVNNTGSHGYPPPRDCRWVRDADRDEPSGPLRLDRPPHG